MRYEIKNSGRTLLSEMLEKSGIELSKPCGGNGKCGKCAVKIIQGDLSPADSAESEQLTKAQFDSGMRLACRTYAEGNVTVELNPKATINGLTAGHIPEEVEPNPITESKSCYALAVDIGTTTIAAYLYKLPEGICVKSVCVPNRQARFGADVISRISYANSGGLYDLYTSINGQIDKIITEFAVTPEFMIVTGNTAMLHFYRKLKTDTLAVAPFTPESLFGEWYGNVYIPRCISAFVGADITCAVLSSGMLNDKNAFLVDIGTNGEMVYFKDGKITCCSTAAGPAFEGAGISCGMTASAGAVNKVFSERGEMLYTTIGNESAIGLCGSGLIDTVAMMVRNEIIDETGYMSEAFQIGESGISVTIDDIRAVQLAKSAIRAGLETLTGGSFEEIERFYIAGGFGNYVDKKNCADIGLIPHSVLNKVTVTGNSSGAGASMLLLNKNYIRTADEIARSATTIELATNPVFTEKYIENMYF